MYSIHDYGKMIRDTERTGAYAEALRAVVRPGSVVLDIGTGTGILTLLACSFGARKVYAFELTDVIELARQAALANGFGEKVEFINRSSTHVELAEKVDLIVSDLHGVLPTFQGSLSSIMAARDRFLVPDGHLIPQRETLWAALVHAPDEYRAVVEPWESNDYGFDCQTIRDKAVNDWRSVRLDSTHLVSDARCWATLDYRSVVDTKVSGQLGWTLNRTATAHGLVIWFDCQVSDGIAFSNSPASPTKLIYGQGFFPFSRPIELLPRDKVSVRVRGDAVGGNYVWCWNTDVTPVADPSRTHISFRQSTFQGVVLSADRLRRRAHNFVTTLSEDGWIDELVLQQMAQRLPLGQIAETLARKFPKVFPAWEDALNRVANLSEEYGE